MKSDTELSWVTPKEELWVTKNLDCLNVSDMTEHHAKNTLRMLIKQIREGNMVSLGYHQGRLRIAKVIVEGV